MLGSASIQASNSVGATAVLLIGHGCTVTFAHGINTTGSAAYVQLFDAAAAADVTVGTTVPRLVLTMAASGSATDTYGTEGTDFANGVVVAATTTATGSSAATTHVRVGVR